MSSLVKNAKKLLELIGNTIDEPSTISIQMRINKEYETVFSMRVQNLVAVKASKVSKFANLYTVYHNGDDHEALKTPCKVVITLDSGDEYAFDYAAGRFSTRFKNLFDKMWFDIALGMAAHDTEVAKDLEKEFVDNMTDLLVGNRNFAESLCVLGYVNKFPSSKLTKIGTTFVPVRDEDGNIIDIDLAPFAKAKLGITEDVELA